MNEVVVSAIARIRRELEAATVEVDVDAIERELFRIAREVGTIEESLEFLTGLLAGQRTPAAVPT